jgi:fructoselysine-6-P-deglycase FrlB-like protein
MNSMQAMEQEIKDQLLYLQNSKLQDPAANCVLVGVGDSYAAALAAQHVSNNQVLCLSPMDIVLNPALVGSRTVYFVSVSGNTRANILAANAVKKRGVRTVAVTAKPASLLARECGEAIELNYVGSGVTTAGTISFMATLIACLSIATRLRIPANTGRLFSSASIQAEKAVTGLHPGKGSNVLLGNGPLFPIAMYGAFKFNEVLGEKALYYSGEEFCHSPIFSIKNSDNIVVLGGKKDNSEALDTRLRKEGFNSCYADFDQDSAVSSIIQSTFFVQLLVLSIAKTRGVTDCYFLKNKRLLQMSSDFIYG